MNAHAQLLLGLDLVADIASVCGLIALPFFVFNFLRHRGRTLLDRSLAPQGLKGRFPIKSVGGFALALSIAALATAFSQRIAQRDVLDVLDKLRTVPPSGSVSIAGRPAEDSPRLLEVLRSLHWAPAHHSHPIHPIFVRLGSPTDELVLNLSRDSSDPREYWVFLPRHHVTSRNEIGRIFTDALDSY